MKKLTAYFATIIVIISCSKDKTTPSLYQELFQISFTFDGKQYKKVLRSDQKNQYTFGGYHDGAKSTYHLGATFFIDTITTITFHLGNYHHIYGDTTGNLERLKHLFRPGPKTYKCITGCDTAIADAVELHFYPNASGLSNWSTTKRKKVNDFPEPIEAGDQTGSSFYISEIKESTTNGFNKNAVIIKGIFQCNLYEINTGHKKLLTNGEFTCIIPTL